MNCLFAAQSFEYSAWVPIHFTYSRTIFLPNRYLPIIRYLLPAILNTTLSLPFPSKSADPNVPVMSSGPIQSIPFKALNQCLKERLLPGFILAKSSITFFLITLTLTTPHYKFTKTSQNVNSISLSSYSGPFHSACPCNFRLLLKSLCSVSTANRCENPQIPEPVAQGDLYKSCLPEQ